MSKSLKRVEAALTAAGIAPEIQMLTESARTAPLAAAAVGCALDQIAKSIIFRGEQSGHVLLFVTAGGNRVKPDAAARLAGEPLGKADAALVRVETGFAIGGVAPIGHLNPIRAFIDRRLLDFPQVWAAAGTPHHLFAIEPARLVEMAGATLATFTG